MKISIYVSIIMSMLHSPIVLISTNQQNLTAKYILMPTMVKMAESDGLAMVQKKELIWLSIYILTLEILNIAIVLGINNILLFSII